MLSKCYTNWLEIGRYMDLQYKNVDNLNFEIRIDINLSFCMPQRISNKKSGLDSEKLKCDVLKYLANQYK